MGIRILIILAFIGLASEAIAQKEVIHEGQACYLHVVEKGNTLYGISKFYAVDVSEVLEMNPEASIGLSISQRLFIPISAVDRRAAKKSPELEGNILVHTVSRGQTLYALSKEYKVPINAILEANPGLEAKGLKKGDAVYIPTVSVQTADEFVTPAVADSLMHHEVIQGETLYGVSKTYEVEIEKLKAVNGGLLEGLRTGMTLRIPIRVDGRSMNPDAGSAIDSTLFSVESPYKSGQEMKIGLLLPFSLGQTTSVIPRSEDDLVKMTDIAFEFYRGVQIALDELSEEGLNASITVLDIENTKEDIDHSIKSKALVKMDLIIGPLHKEAFEFLAADKRMSEVFRVSPLSRGLGKLSKKDQYASQVRTDKEFLVKATVEDVIKHHAESTVIMMSHTKRSSHVAVQRYWSAKDSLTKSIALTTIPWGNKARPKLLAALKPNGKNVIIFPVEDAPAVAGLMADLATSDFRDHDITLYGMESWMSYDNLDADVLERLKLHIACSRFLDWKDPLTIDFTKEYEARFSTIPSSSAYAFVGYDLTRFYVKGLMAFGEEFLSHQDYTLYNGLSIGFDMHKHKLGNWENKYCHMVSYQDFEFIKKP